MFIYIIPLRSYISTTIPLGSYISSSVPIQPRTLTTLLQNLNEKFSRIQYRGTAPPKKKTVQAGPPNLAWKRQMDNGHSSCKPTKAKPSRKRCFAIGTSAWTCWGMRKSLEVGNLWDLQVSDSFRCGMPFSNALFCQRFLGQHFIWHDNVHLIDCATGTTCLRISSKLSLRDVQLPNNLSGLETVPPGKGEIRTTAPATSAWEVNRTGSGN